MNALLAELIDKYGEGALLTVGPYVLDSLTDDFRWVVQIDGVDLPELDVYVRPDPDFAGGHVLSISRELAARSSRFSGGHRKAESPMPGQCGRFETFETTAESGARRG